MSVQQSNLKFVDKSDEQGYKFSFHCEICNDSYATKYVEAQSGRKSSIIRFSSKAMSLGSSLMDILPVSDKPNLDEIEKKQSELSGELAKYFEGMSPEWHKGHDTAFQEARREAEKYFRNCPICKRWVCPRDWNESYNCCLEDSQQSVCSKCHQLAGGGKFCVNCGTKLETACPSCGAKYNAGTKFCGECGARIAAT